MEILHDVMYLLFFSSSLTINYSYDSLLFLVVGCHSTLSFLETMDTHARVHVFVHISMHILIIIFLHLPTRTNNFFPAQ
jgi:hypothetical protein